MIFAEVIGDPVAHSMSPLIHNHWLRLLGIAGKYRATRITAEGLDAFLEERRCNPDWRGCNVTIPLKETILDRIDELDPLAARIGAVNCIIPREGRLTGSNSDVDGIAEALRDTAIDGRKVTVIGAGGAARAAVACCAQQGAREITIVARDPRKAEALWTLACHARMDVAEFSKALGAFQNANLIINASPLGMAGFASMPEPTLEELSASCRGATLFDMVYVPRATPFLTAGMEGGARTIGGLAMLVGQAAKAFETFFGHAPPPANAELYDALDDCRAIAD